MKSTLLIPLAPSLCHAPIPTTGFLVVESIRGHHQALKDIERSESYLRVVVNAMIPMEHIVLLFVETFGKTQKPISVWKPTHLTSVFFPTDIHFYLASWY
jgi:hypothetical protein